MQDTDNKVPTQEDENEKALPEYMKLCAELSLNMALGESELRERVFHLITGTAVFGICIGELEDSFLVALPTQLVSESDKIDGKPFSKGKIIRLIRSSIAFISIPEPEHRYYYFRWLKRQFTTLPSFFTQDRRDIVNDFVYAYDNRNTNKVEQKDQKTEVPKVEDESAKGSSDSFWSSYQSTEFH